MKPIRVIVGPVGSTAANNVATSQTPSAPATATVTFTNSSASITVTNTFVAGQLVYFTTTGQLPYPLQDIYQGFPGGPVIYYVSATGLSGSAFQVSGSYGGTPIVMNTAAVGTSGLPGFWPAAAGTQTVNYGGNVALNGSLVVAGAAVFPVQQRVLLTTTDSTHTATIIGTSPTGLPLTEIVTFTGSAVTSALDYLTVTSITVNGTLSAALTVGNGGNPLCSAWVRLDEWAVSPVAIQCDVTGTVNFTIQSSMDEPSLGGVAPDKFPYTMTWNNTNDLLAVNATGSLQTSFYTGVPLWGRIVLNSGSGSVIAIFGQSGEVMY